MGRKTAPAMMQIQHLPTDSLIPADYNPRKIADDQMAALCRSIEQFGFVEPIVLNTRSGLIVGGHQRVAAAKRLGMATVPVVEVDLDDAKEKALNVALNKISGEFDFPKLHELLESLDIDDLALTGFTPDDLDGMLTGLTPGGEGEWGDAIGGLPSGDKSPFQQKTFTLTDEQAGTVDAAIEKAKGVGDFEGTGNENSNGNALALACEMFLGMRT